MIMWLIVHYFSVSDKDAKQAMLFDPPQRGF